MRETKISVIVSSLNVVRRNIACANNLGSQPIKELIRHFIDEGLACAPGRREHELSRDFLSRGAGVRGN